MTCRILTLMFACLLAGCNTGPVQTNNPNPPSPSWSISDSTTQKNLPNLVPAGSLMTVNIAPGDNYVVIFQAASPGGVQNVTLSGTGEVICHNNQRPYNEGQPFTYSIPANTITPTVQPGQPVFTQAINFFEFFWAPGQGLPASLTPAADAYTKCGAQVPLLGSTTYTGQATSFSGVSSSPTSLRVTTCPGLVSSPSQQACGS